MNNNVVITQFFNVLSIASQLASVVLYLYCSEPCKDRLPIRCEASLCF